MKKRFLRSQPPSADRRLLGACAAALIALAAMVPDAARADDAIRFDGGIGSQPLRAGALVNDAFGVAPGGRPWVISELRAHVRGDTRIRVDGRGLLLGGGDATGTPGAVTTVRARLACVITPATATTPGVYQYFDSATVPLDANGDFRIDSAITPVSPGTTLCSNPGLLILNGGGTAWFAAGIPKR